jgi:hypothetical protein
VRFYPNAGDVLTWHAQLLHGGSPIKNLQETRNTLVTHYWTTLDIPDPAERIEVGEGRYLLAKPQQSVVDDWDSARIDAFVRSLTTSPEHLVDLPRALIREPTCCATWRCFTLALTPIPIIISMAGGKVGAGKGFRRSARTCWRIAWR